MIRVFKIYILILISQIYSVKMIYAGIFENLQPVKIATNMQFTEGPSWNPKGFLVFSDINGNVIYKWSETGGLDTLVFPAGNSNGIAMNRRNTFYIARHGGRDIAKMGENGNVSVFVSQFNGKKFNSPNDVEINYLGSIYFTDPDFGANSANREFSYEGLFCIPYNKTEVFLLDSTLVKPNGMTFLNDWRTLYVGETSTNTIYSYTLRNEYQIQDITKDKKVFVKLSGTGEIDGMTSDIFGNIYVAYGNGGIKILNKDAVEVGTISFPAGEKVRNLCFGGKYNNLLFVTAGTSLYKVDIRFWGDFIVPGILGVPTDKSVVFNSWSDKNMVAYIAYGTDSLKLNLQTVTKDYPANNPINISIDGLNSNTLYFYQLYYKIQGNNSYTKATSGSFCTQRALGSSFSFAVEADPHLDEGSNYLTFRNTLQNALSLKPDFLIDLGDNFMVEKWPIVDSNYMMQRNLFYRHFWDKVCKSMPLFIVQGNHEPELRWLSKNTASDTFNTATRIRKMIYPSPQPDGFYTGNNIPELFVGFRANYYAWNWGDALFVVIDPYGYTGTKPTDPWGFTLGKTQYDWFRKTLEESNAKFKFVFAHQIVGGYSEGRGGTEIAHLYENGGYNIDGSYGFDAKRPGWGKPLHQIMVENGVQIYFHGHDHIYAEQEKDGIIYQEVPQPSFPSYTSISTAADYGYVTGTILPNAGHLNVQVLGDSARVDYIGGYHVNNPGLGLINGNSRRTYFVKANINTNTTEFAKSNQKIEVYLNGNNLVVKSPTCTNAKISIYSLSGQYLGIIQQGIIQSGTVIYNIPVNLNKGLYLIHLKTKEYTNTYKILK